MLHAIATSFYKYFSRHIYIQQYQTIYTFNIGSTNRIINKTIDFKMYYISKLKIFLFLRNILYFAYVNIIGNAKQIS